MGCPGFEPGTSRLKAECSTTELATRCGMSCLDAALKSNTQSSYLLEILYFYWRALTQPGFFDADLAES